MAQIAQIVKFTAKSGRGPDIVKALETAAVAAAVEPGTYAYAIHTAVDNPDVVWMYELYADTAAQQAHSGSEASTQLRAAVGDLVDAPTELNRCELHQAFGLASSSPAAAQS